MIFKTVRDRVAAIAMAVALVAGPAFAGPAELGLLTSYVGEWRGDSELVGGNKPEPFKCRLTMAKGNQAKINYSGRCTLVNMNLSVTGTISYNDKERRYEAIMSTNAGFTGLAVGRIQGDKISFKLEERQTDKGGNNIRIGSIIILEDDSITVNYEVEFNESGHVLTAMVPFAR
jgi:hypothetical protein